MYRETPPPASLRGLVECAWWSDARGNRVLPDGCMDLLLSPDGGWSVAGPDTSAFLASGTADWTAGIRFHPGVLPRLLGVPAEELRDRREPVESVAPRALRPLVADLRPARSDAGAGLFGAVERLVDAAVERRETAPWSLTALGHVTARLGTGAAVADLADELGWSTRSLTRHCTAVFGYGPTVLRRILRFRAAADLLYRGVAPAEVAARTGYADQPHLTREVRSLACVPPSALVADSRPDPVIISPHAGQGSAAKRSMWVPSGSVTVA
ncbi:AraC family transcriptional regulator [Pseudonocardia xishanensis]|uniref:AraC family transcriptional regulator n=1 Tax=Pseudonocardia xishanensis TaxID=630995 RepID=A0ABP8RGJ2_9PSEU